ncbi:glycoside hydrolase family 17 protein [Colletotrichum scovillei]|nr:glycoside hydrolase family 17 protein [Colletotrichum scovillei]KAG7083086.1 glycoside hydrolase family 17 protein [Colletotrichum scovillei]
MYLMTAVAASLATTVLAGNQPGLLGFNYGATNEDGSCRGYDDFLRYFQNAKTLAGADDKNFTSARLYTSIQCNNTYDPTSSWAEPTSAYKAAIDSNTKILVGLWASAGSQMYINELRSLTAAYMQYGEAFTNLVIGISVGSEDLYRHLSGLTGKYVGVGADASVIVGYIADLRSLIKQSIPPLANKPIGHVDTYTAWILPENAAVVEAVDWLGHNSFPYWESDKNNTIENAPDLFISALDQTREVAARSTSACGNGKEVWVTETGWPHAGKSQGAAVASVENARLYWTSVGCDLFQTSLNVFWYILLDSNADQVNNGIEFGLTRNSDVSRPAFNLSCPSLPDSSGEECDSLKFYCVFMAVLCAANGCDGSLNHERSLGSSQWQTFMDSLKGSWLGIINAVRALSSKLPSPLTDSAVDCYYSSVVAGSYSSFAAITGLFGSFDATEAPSVVYEFYDIVLSSHTNFVLEVQFRRK